MTQSMPGFNGRRNLDCAGEARLPCEPVAVPKGQARRVLGQRGEQEAERFLLSQRYSILVKNYRSPLGEIDLIALDHQTVVFVEVRTHTGDAFGDPLASVNMRKQRQITKTALYYLMRNGLNDCEARFDVIGIRWEAGAARLTHIKGAFEVTRDL